MDLSALEGLERESVLQVLQRDKVLRSLEEERIRRMRSDLQEIRRKGAKSFARQYSERTCARCQRPLGRLWDSGATCRGCSHRICSKCRITSPAHGWECTVCHAYRDLKIKSGEWFLEERAKKFPGGLDRHDTTGEKILKSYQNFSHIAIVPPTPPPFATVPSFNRSGGLQTSKPFTKSMENLFVSLTSHIKKISKSHNDVTADPALLTADSCSVYRKERRSQSDTAINWPFEVCTVECRRPSLSELLRQDRAEEGAESSPAYTDDDTSPGAELPLDKRGSVGSISVGDLGLLDPNVCRTGEIELGLGYSLGTSRLEVSVRACRNLPFGDPKRKKCHPCVKLHLLPDGSKLKTAVKRNTTDPVFNETLEFSMERPLLAGRTLQASVWHSGTLKRRVFLGEALLPLDGWNFEENLTQSARWHQLCPRTKTADIAVEQQNRGLLVRVRFSSSSSSPRQERRPADQPEGGTVLGQLTIQVTGTRNMVENLTKSPGCVNVSVRGLLSLPGGPRQSQEALLQEQGSGSLWSGRLEFSAVPAPGLQGASLELSLWDPAPQGPRPRLLGTARLEEASSWQRVQQTPSTWHDFGLPVQASET
ncbi:synaptotagmin-like protein 3 [Conger conger]|uniref:synaptotagmin-like protein 3 n=1 Tax=Conger conger TaxID=82655 RepID=UPI002A599083|nr:synaptotagmin-like protein 3 [Conger conger]